MPLAKSTDTGIAREARKSLVDLKSKLKGQRDAEKKIFSGVYAKPRPDPVVSGVRESTASARAEEATASARVEESFNCLGARRGSDF